MRFPRVVVPKSGFFDRFSIVRFGELELRETTDKQLQRLSRLAMFHRDGIVDQLFDAKILWIESVDRMMLTGFDEVGTTHYAQS